MIEISIKIDGKEVFVSSKQVEELLLKNEELSKELEWFKNECNKLTNKKQIEIIKETPHLVKKPTNISSKKSKHIKGEKTCLRCKDKYPPRGNNQKLCEKCEAERKEIHEALKVSPKQKGKKPFPVAKERKCEDCEVPFSPGSNRQTKCFNCRKKQIKRKDCRKCKKKFNPKYDTQVYCQDCMIQMGKDANTTNLVSKPCAICGTSFNPLNHSVKKCEKCEAERKEIHEALKVSPKQKGKKPFPVAKERKCEDCEVPFSPGSNRQTKCFNCRKKQIKRKDCRKCKKKFNPKYDTQVYCQDCMIQMGKDANTTNLVSKPCAICGTSFNPLNHSVKKCDKCREAGLPLSAAKDTKQEPQTEVKEPTFKIGKKQVYLPADCKEACARYTPEYNHFCSNCMKENNFKNFLSKDSSSVFCVPANQKKETTRFTRKI